MSSETSETQLYFPSKQTISYERKNCKIELSSWSRWSRKPVFPSLLRLRRDTKLKLSLEPSAKQIGSLSFKFHILMMLSWAGKIWKKRKLHQKNLGLFIFISIWRKLVSNLFKNFSTPFTCLCVIDFKKIFYKFDKNMFQITLNVSITLIY